ncbi:glycosyltransferase [Paucibacter sp. Y2R2-4]|uniref:glycosyltransferase n=1 Tax=Paucibacter sp. Y2R2-4 TaxID=2893553 RepID=UPI0021E50757|nr:glycosyltransferase [Paucibacter sp. Y2R2-4]MCV2349747.1 glycosyltransferase [Paucibacter sp. Y2R2-4]
MKVQAKNVNKKPLRWVLIGDGESPHLLKWARALAQRPDIELWAASSRGFLPEFDWLIPSARRFAMNTRPEHAGGNLSVFKQLPALGAWLAEVDADWLHAHYLTSHGTLAWAARRGWRLRARIIGSAWGSDILVTPQQGWAYRWLTRKVLHACALTTSDSQHMSGVMKTLGAGEVMIFPFGLEAMPKPSNTAASRKQPWLFFANRGLEPIYRPERVIAAFATVAAQVPEARLVVANDGSLREALLQQARDLGLAERVQFVGRLDATTQASHYAKSTWYFSLPQSDSVAVSVLEAMAHGCVPLLSDLPANHELLGEPVQRGLILDELSLPALPTQLQALGERLPAMAAANRTWVAEHGLFAPAIEKFLKRVKELDSTT